MESWNRKLLKGQWRVQGTTRSSVCLDISHTCSSKNELHRWRLTSSTSYNVKPYLAVFLRSFTLNKWINETLHSWYQHWKVFSAATTEELKDFFFVILWRYLGTNVEEICFIFTAWKNGFALIRDKCSKILLQSYYHTYWMPHDSLRINQHEQHTFGVTAWTDPLPPNTLEWVCISLPSVKAVMLT